MSSTGLSENQKPTADGVIIHLVGGRAHALPDLAMAAIETFIDGARPCFRCTDHKGVSRLIVTSAITDAEPYTPQSTR